MEVRVPFLPPVFMPAIICASRDAPGAGGGATAGATAAIGSV